jgi:hypothetical protein
MSRLLWTLPDIPLGAPAPDDPNYMLVTDDRLDEYEPRMHLGRVPYTHYPIKIPTLPRYAESLAYGYLRNRRSAGEGHSRRAGFFLYELGYIGEYCKLDPADLEPRIRRFWRIWDNPRSSQPMFRYSARLAAELREANFFPRMMEKTNRRASEEGHDSDVDVCWLDLPVHCSLMSRHTLSSLSQMLLFLCPLHRAPIHY